MLLGFTLLDLAYMQYCYVIAVLWLLPTTLLTVTVLVAISVCISLMPPPLVLSDLPISPTLPSLSHGHPNPHIYGTP